MQLECFHCTVQGAGLGERLPQVTVKLHRWIAKGEVFKVCLSAALCCTLSHTLCRRKPIATGTGRVRLLVQQLLYWAFHVLLNASPTSR